MGWASFPRENSKATFSLSLSLWESFLSTSGFCIQARLLILNAQNGEWRKTLRIV